MVGTVLDQSSVFYYYSSDLSASIKMKLVSIVVALCLCIVIEAENYDTRYDTINLDEVLGNKRLTASYIKCVLEQGKCTAEGRELKEHITEALKTGCSKCTEAQRAGTRRVIRHLISYEPQYWKQLVKMYDPDNVFTKKYEKELSDMQ